MQKLDILLSLVGPILHSGLIAIFISRKLYRKLPFFFCFSFSTVIISVVRLSVSGTYQTFFKVFWATEAIYAVLTLLVLHEIFHEVFQAFFDAWWWFRLIFPAIVLITFGITIYHVLAYPPTQVPSVINLVLSLSSANNYLQAAIFVVFFLLVWLLATGWDNYPFGVMAGFAASTAGIWLVSALRSEFGTRFNIVWKYGLSVSNFLAVVVWLITFWRPQPETKWGLGMAPEQMLEEVRQYIRILRKGLGAHDDSE